MATQTETSPSPGRARTKSMLSFASHKSSGSGGKAGKMDLTETPRDKAHRRMTSKADPTLAMKELQPAQAAFDENTMESLHSIQHKDIHGNIITDPDRSNPTRPRLERPLDTIRSFEAAIDGSYNKRFSVRPVSHDSAAFQSRRSSYYQGYNNSSAQARYPGDGGFNNGSGRMGPSRPDSYVDNYSSRNSPAPFRESRRMNLRNQSEPMLYNGSSNGGYNTNHTNQQSYDTSTTVSGSGNSYGTEPYANSTDPSSENSSVDRIPQPNKPDLAEVYGFNGFGGAPEFQGPILEEMGQGAPAYGQPGYGQQGSGQRVPVPPKHSPNGYAHPQNGRTAGYARQGQDLPPPPPPHQHGAPTPRYPTRLQSMKRVPPHGSAGLDSREDNGEKRKSWLKRRFSKKL